MQGQLGVLARPDQSAVAEPRRGRGLLTVLELAALGALAAILVLAGSRAGMVRSADSAVYLDTAQHLSMGLGPTVSSTYPTARIDPVEAFAADGHIPQSDFPPGYPVALVILHWAGLSWLGAARAVGAIAAAIAVVALALLARRLTGAPPPVLALMALAALAGPIRPVVGSSPLMLSGSLLSDALFLALCLSAFLVAVGQAGQRAGRRVGLLVGLVAAASLTRLVGVALGPAIVAFWFLDARRGGRQRPGRLAAAAVAGAGPAILASWLYVASKLWGDAGFRGLAWHPPGREVQRLGATAASWFGLPTGSGLGRLIGLVLLVTPVVLVIIRYRRRAEPPRLNRCPADISPTPPVNSTALLIVCFEVAYVLVVLVSEVLFDALTAFDRRIAAPLQLSTYLLLTFLAVEWLRSSKRQVERIGLTSVARVMPILAAGVLALLVAPAVVREVQQLPSGARLSVGPPSPADALGATSVVFTTDPMGRYFRTGHAGLMVPLTVVVTEDRTNVRFAEQLRAVVSLVGARHGVIDLRPVAVSAAAPTVDDVLRAGGSVVLRCANDVIMTGPGSSASDFPDLRCPPSTGSRE